MKFPDAQEVIETYQRFGDPIPDELIAPEINDAEAVLWSEFWELSTDRQRGVSPGPIPGSVVRAYPSAVPLNILVPVIRAMDGVYLSHADDRQKQDKPFNKEMMKGK